MNYHIHNLSTSEMKDNVFHMHTTETDNSITECARSAGGRCVSAWCSAVLYWAAARHCRCHGPIPVTSRPGVLALPPLCVRIAPTSPVEGCTLTSVRARRRNLQADGVFARGFAIGHDLRSLPYGTRPVRRAPRVAA